jgi:hypothetical protein
MVVVPTSLTGVVLLLLLQIRSLNSYDGKSSFIWGAKSSLVSSILVEVRRMAVRLFWLNVQGTPHSFGLIHHNASTGAMKQIFSYGEGRATHPGRTTAIPSHLQSFES